MIEGEILIRDVPWYPWQISIKRTIHFKLITGYKARQKNYLSHLSSYIAKLFWFVINNTAKALGDDNEKTVAITMIIFF